MMPFLEKQPKESDESWINLMGKTVQESKMCDLTSPSCLPQVPMSCHKSQWPLSSHSQVGAPKAELAHFQPRKVFESLS